MASVPPWQPDEAVKACPICGASFTFFYRRHHCRKCGRVVCGECSSQERSYLVGSYVVSPPSQVFLESPHVPHRTCDVCVEELDMIQYALEGGDNFRTSLRHRHTNPGILEFEVAKSNDVRETTNSVSSAPIAEDESNYCPICNARLSSLSEVDKERHINDCLERNQFLGSPEAARSPNRMLVYRLPKDFKGFHIKQRKIKNRPETVNAKAGSYDSMGVGSLHEQEGAGSDNAIEAQETAEEYMDDGDDVDSINECCICLEGFGPDDKVGRLECLCVFHYKCITDWFRKKGPGECPVHAVHA